MELALLPPQSGIHFDDPSHRYWVWSPRRDRWMQPASTSQVLTLSGAKGFDSTYWRRSLIEKDGLRPHEADVYMDLHRNGRATIGTELHGLIRAELLGGSFHPRHAESLMLLATWRREFLPRIGAVLACESPLASLQRFYTGTPDLLAVIDGLLLTCDWKTKVSQEKAKPDNGWGLQLGGYDQLIRDNYGIEPDGALNLMIWPGGIGDVFYNRADVMQRRITFNQALLVHHRIRADDGCIDHQGALRHLEQCYQLGLAPTGVMP